MISSLQFAVFLILCIAIYLEIGLFVSLILGLFWMYFNTSTDPIPKGKLSAYSVFNKGQQKIDGTLSAEQLEAEIYKKST